MLDHITLVVILYTGSLPFQNDIDSINIRIPSLYDLMLLKLFQHGCSHDSLAVLAAIDVAELL